MKNVRGQKQNIEKWPPKQKNYLLTIATILLLPFYKCLRLKIIFQDRRGKMFCRSNFQSKRKKKDKETEINRTMVSGGGGQKSLWINCSTYVINKKSSSHYYLGIPTSIFFLCISGTHKNGILFPKLFWPTVRKIVPVILQIVWNSMLKAENLQIFWEH